MTSDSKKAQLAQGLHAAAPSFQDGGCSKMAVTRHLGYYRTGNSAIRSADPKNLILEPNITPIGKAVAKLWPLLYIQDGCQRPSWILSNCK